MVLSRVVPCGLGLAGVQAGSGAGGRAGGSLVSPPRLSPVARCGTGGQSRAPPRAGVWLFCSTFRGPKDLGRGFAGPSYEPWARGTCRPHLLPSPALFSPPAWLCSFPLHTLPSLRDRLGK